MARIVQVFNMGNELLPCKGGAPRLTCNRNTRIKVYIHEPDRTHTIALCRACLSGSLLHIGHWVAGNRDELPDWVNQ